MAENHARATKVSAEIPKEVLLQHTNREPTQCPCCNYQIEREEIPYMADISKINFLGSGFVCFYNFIIYCTFMLVVLFTVSGIFNIVTNYLGSNCLTPDQDLALSGGYTKENLAEKLEKELSSTTTTAKPHEGEEHGGSEEAEKEGMHVCHYNWAHIFSLANKMDMPQYLATQSNLNLVVGFLIMVILMFFRRSQRELDAEVDAANITPGDYTIVVKNIPKELGGEKEYKDILSKLIV